MESLNEQLKVKIMDRVDRIYCWKNKTRPVVVECAMLFTIAGGSTFLVSVGSVCMNASSHHSLYEISKYILVSLLKTEFSIKVLFLAGTVLSILILRNVFSGVGEMVRSKIRFILKRA